jgi:hypothetical protein
MASFLSLPMEIREKIYLFAIPHLRLPPNVTLPEHSCCHRRARVISDAPRGRHVPLRGIWFDDTPIYNPALPLMQVNRLIHNEIKTSFQRFPSEYHLDVLFLNEWGLWPTWTYIPGRNWRHIDDFYIQFRMANPPGGKSRFADYSSGHGFTLSRIQFLMRSIFTSGPWETQCHSTPIPHPRYFLEHVKRLTINIITPLDSKANETARCLRPEDYKPAIEWTMNQKIDHPDWPAKWPRQSGWRSIEDITSPEERMAMFLSRIMLAQLDITNTHPAFSQYLYECGVESIDILIDGKSQIRLDVEAMLQSMILPERWGRWMMWDSFLFSKLPPAEWHSWVNGHRNKLRQQEYDHS